MLLTTGIPTTIMANIDEQDARNYIIKFKDSAAREKIKTRLKEIGGQVNRESKYSKILTSRLNGRLAALLEKLPSVEAIEPDYEIEMSSESTPESVRMIGGLDAHNSGHLGQGIKIAVMDTGIANHSDLNTRGGISLVPSTTSYLDDQGHGTHVAGTIAALVNNSGLVGVAPLAEIYSIKVLDKYGKGNYSSIIEGIQWAIDNGIDVINMSFGGGEYSALLEEAINQAYAKGISIVASAGNGGNVTYPAKYEKVIAVGAVDNKGTIAAFSSRGSEVDIVAPGVDVESTYLNGTYSRLSGTSMSAPHVSGSVALLLSDNPVKTNAQIEEMLYASATRIGDTQLYGHGLVNLYSALSLQEQSPGNEDNPIDTEVPITQGFDIITMNESLSSAQDKLVELFNIANDNGDITIAKAIDQTLQALLTEDRKLHELPSKFQSSFQSSTKDEASSQSLQAEINFYYKSKEVSFYELQNKYMSAISEFSALLHIPDDDPNESTDEQNINKETSNDFIESKQAHLAQNSSDDSTHDTSVLSLDIEQPVYPNESIYIDEPIVTFEPFIIELPEDAIYTESEETVEDQAAIPVPNNMSTFYYNDVTLPANNAIAYPFTPSTTGQYIVMTGPYAGTGADSDTCLDIYGDQALTNKLATNNNSAGTVFSSITYTFTAGKTYYIKLYGNNYIGISTRFSILNQLTPTTLSLDVVAETTVQPSGAVLFKFVAPTTGSYSFLTSPYNGTGGNSNTYLELFSDLALTNRLAYNDDYTSRNNFSNINYGLTAGTAYYIKVTGVNLAGASARFYISQEVVLPQNVYVDAKIPVGDSLVFKFTPTSTDSYNIYTSAYAGTGGSSDTYLEIFSDASLKNRLAYNDDYSGAFSRITHSMNAGTAYYIRLTGYNFGSVSARLTVERNMPVLSLNTGVDVSLPAGQNKAFKFTPTATAMYNITTSPYAGTGASNDTYLELYSDEAMTNRIAFNDDGAGNSFSKISMTLNAGVTYFVKLRHYNTTTALQARITVAKDMAIVSVNTPVDVSVPQGEYKLFKFTPSSSSYYTFTTSSYANNGSSSDTYLELYSDENMTKLLSVNDDFNGTLFSSIEYNLVAGVSYYIKLKGYNYNSINARFTVASLYLSDSEVLEIATYHNSSYINDTVTADGSKKITLYDNTNRIIAYAVPYTNAQGNVVSHIVVGALRDGFNFYHIDHTSLTFSEIKSWENQGYKVQFSPPMGYLKISAGAQNDESEQIDPMYDYIQSEENRRDTENLLNLIRSSQADVNNTEDISFSSYPREDARLTSEWSYADYPYYNNDRKEFTVPRLPLFLNIVGHTAMWSENTHGYDRFYGGNQAWFTNPNIITNYKKTGCGTTAAANIFAYLATRPNNSHPSLLLNYKPDAKGEITREDFTAYMNEVVKEVTPTIIGITSATMLGDAMVKFATKHDTSFTKPSEACNYDYGLTTLNQGGIGYIDIDKLSTFIKGSLNNDAPVAMLQYWNSDLAKENKENDGEYLELHWTTITKYIRDTADNRYVVVSTWGNRMSLNLKTCIKTSFPKVLPEFLSFNY